MKIAIAGYATEGEASTRYWLADGAHEIYIYDENPQALEGKTLPTGVQVGELGPGSFSRIHDVDMIIRTPSAAPDLFPDTIRHWSATNEFFVKCPAPIIGITGSKGKGTTASMIAAFLEADGKTVHFVGNIGVPALDLLADIQPDDIVVYELSSYQLWDIEASPSTAVLLFIEPEHLDVHKTLESYLAAKKNIVRFQTPADRLVYLTSSDYTVEIANTAVSHKTAVPSSEGAHIVGDALYYGETKLCLVDAIHLVGEHNRLNTLAAIEAAWPYLSLPTSVEAGLARFQGLPHRLSYVATVDGVAYYDDSIATTPGSAIAALASFADQQVCIILGGSTKQADFTSLAGALAAHHHATALLVGDEAARIAEACRAAGFTRFQELGHMSMDEIVRTAHRVSAGEGVVLLSPAAASFDSFKNYADRGDQFIAAVRALPQEI